MKKCTIYWWVPLIIGCLIYTLFRTDYLIYNKLLGNLFKPLTFADTFLERVIVFSLPDGLWAMSYTILIFHIRKDKTVRTIIWSLIIPVIGAFSEIGQFYLLIPGTFDFIDLIMYIVAPSIVIRLIL
tara:strand:+ start:263 stop:643 length:381 start_codon:yes stop_codon:yes gene_type:complete